MYDYSFGDCMFKDDKITCHCEVPKAQHHVRQHSCNLSCHCEERSDVAIATPANLNDDAITTSDLRPPRNDRKELNDFKKNAAFTLAEGATHVGMCDNIRRCAFTLAEVLITLAIIGVVAAMTIPTLVANYQNKAWSTSAQVFERKLEEALKTMNTQQTLAGYSNTADFVAELGKHFKITKVCKNDDLMSCFEDKVTWGDEEVDMTKVKNAKNFGQDDWDTELIGVQFGNGTSGIIAYNPDCKEQPFSNQFTGTSCLALLYDTDGFKKPNTQQKDLRSINVLSLGGSNCAFEINGTCYTAPFTPTPLTLAECQEEVAKGELGIKYCYNDDDYWAGAVKACGGVSKMPTLAQLADIANYVYNTSDIGARTGNYDLTRDTDKVAKLGFILNLKNSTTFSLWAGEFDSPDQRGICTRAFYPTYTLYGNNASRSKNNDVQTVCLGD